MTELYFILSHRVIMLIKRDVDAVYQPLTNVQRHLTPIFAFENVPQ